jgi:hypothetical protein
MAMSLGILVIFVFSRKIQIWNLLIWQYQIRGPLQKIKEVEIQYAGICIPDSVVHTSVRGGLTYLREHAVANDILNLLI